nr:hypothetical protein BaRGS_033244 [Batillaria attramentaria]
MLDRNYTAYVTEWYDQGFNYGRVHQLQFMEEGDMYFDYEHNQLITVDRYSGYASGQERIYAPSGALHFGDAPEVYVGTDVVRGIAVDVWNSCQYSPTLDATMNVTWAHVVGRRNDPGGGSHAFEHIYDLFDFATDFDTTHLQEHYDLDNKINVYRYKDKRELGLLTGQNDRTEINDFNEGLAS